MNSPANIPMSSLSLVSSEETSLTLRSVRARLTQPLHSIRSTPSVSSLLRRASNLSTPLRLGMSLLRDSISFLKRLTRLVNLVYATSVLCERSNCLLR